MKRPAELARAPWIWKKSMSNKISYKFWLCIPNLLLQGLTLKRSIWSGRIRKLTVILLMLVVWITSCLRDRHSCLKQIWFTIAYIWHYLDTSIFISKSLGRKATSINWFEYIQMKIRTSFDLAWFADWCQSIPVIELWQDWSEISMEIFERWFPISS